jgi:hypothetical protein
MTLFLPVENFTIGRKWKTQDSHDVEDRCFCMKKENGDV